MKVTVSFFFFFLNEIDATPEMINNENEIKIGIVETLKPMCTDNGSVEVENVHIDCSES